MKQNKIIFDLGNVLLDVKLENFTDYVDNLVAGWPAEYRPKYSAFTFLEKLQPLQDIGVTNLDKALLDYLPPLYDFDNFLMAWYSTVSINQKMLSFVRKLQSWNIEIALLSNIGMDHAAWWRAEKLLPNTIEHFSYEVGARKPSKLYFQSFILNYPEFKVSGCRPTLYLDDRPENLVTAEEVGFRSYLFELNKFSLLSEVEQDLQLEEIKNAL